MLRSTPCCLLSLVLLACGPEPGEEVGAIVEKASHDSWTQALDTPFPTGKHTVTGWVTTRWDPIGGPWSFTLTFKGSSTAIVSGPCCTELTGYSVHFDRTGEHSFLGSYYPPRWDKSVHMELDIDPATGGGKLDFDLIKRTYTDSAQYHFKGAMQP